MLLAKFLSESRILPQLQVSDKPRAIAELTRLLFPGQNAEMVDSVLDQIMARESLESTGIGRGIAVPHARVVGIDDLVCAVGRIEKGLAFHAVDRNPVHLVFLICYPPTHQTTYLNFIATLVRLFQHDEPLPLLLKARTANEILTTLSEASALLMEPETHLADNNEAHPEALFAAETPGAVVLMARLELFMEMLESSPSAQDEINQRIEHVSALLDPKLLAHFRKLRKRYRRAVVAVEVGICQGCSLQLPSRLAQAMLRDRNRVECCPNCHRFVYLI